MTSREQLENVRFLGRHPAEEMPDFLRAADALVVHLRPSEIADHAVPTKILSYLAAGRPVLCATTGASAALVRDADAGIVCAPGDAGALSDAVKRLAEMPPAQLVALGGNGRAYLRAHFDKQTVIDEYERTLVELASPRRAGAVL